jgi:acyl dehydratase
MTSTWTIVELVDKPAHGGGVVTLSGTATIQTGVVVAEAEARMLVSLKPR